MERLGPDPLRADADPGRAWRRIQRSDRAIGDLIMDQEVLAGVGNVYRAEVLFRHRIDPLRPGRSLRRSQWQAVWDDLVELLAEGVRTGRIDTVRPEHTPGGDGSSGPQGRPRRRGVRLSPDRSAVSRLRDDDPHQGAQRPQPVLVPALPAEVPVTGQGRH